MSNRVIWWKCIHCFSEFKKSVAKQVRDWTNNGIGCPFCSGKHQTNETNSLFTKYPNLIKYWSEENIISPNDIRPNSTRIIYWKCKNCSSVFENTMQSYLEKFKNKTYNSQLCSNCIKIWIKDNSIGSKYPELLKEWNYEKNIISPYEIEPGSRKKIHWKCEKYSHNWEALISHRIDRKDGCPYCGNRKICNDNNFAVTFPILLKEWDYERNIISPYKIFPHSSIKIWWKCAKHNYSWEMGVGTRTGTAKGGCPKCACVISLPEIAWLNFLKFQKNIDINLLK